ncbi:uncharacterized protein ATNIH1004_007875 [Aspergillus tanneri]|uniref:Uncharacterized protein n=1 Tax=Aspergillus tanneri TaxID=1220188 RepID=A0A5M9MHI0_9EURO|nr:uncharacterized protein ATNIH1004_007875 [Aspergillus tanneri]KAA8646445.1 hypothetical protein ATNIH1004_007875 [Aspergillus tanneri]
MTSLMPNNLYIALYIRTDPPQPNNFHWTLYHHHYHHDSASPATGTKYHIINESTGWIATHGRESCILKTFLLFGLVRIASVPWDATDAIDRSIRMYDSQLNAMGVTCRTWLFRVLRDLQEDEHALQGVDLEALEEELTQWGYGFADEACRNVVDPQSAVLSNIEVLAYITANPPRRPPNPPPNSRNWVPSPDLRDHNTVVKETQRPAPLDQSAPIDDALRELIQRLQPFGLTKGEVLMIINLGVGLHGSSMGEDGGEEGGEQLEEAEGVGEQDGEMPNGVDEMQVDAQGEEEGVGAEEAAGELSEDDYGALALLDTVIEEREERLSNEDVGMVLTIIRETLGPKGENRPVDGAG